MNKKLLTAAIVTMMALSTGAAMAAPVTIDGSASYRYRHDTNTVYSDKNGSIYRFTLNAKTALNSNVTAYARFATEGLTNENCGSDMIQNNPGKFIGEVDQFGIIYTNKNITYKVGKQDATIGGTGLIYDSTGYLGKNNGLSGISITGTTGVTSVSVLAGQENSYGPVDNKVYSVRAAFSPAKDLTLGATYARFNAANNSIFKNTGSNFYAVDVAYSLNKATYSAEYAKSNADGDNKAYDLGVSYAFDKKNSASITYFKVENNATMNQEDFGTMTGFEGNGKGFYYSFTHKFTKDTSATLFYRDYKEIIGSNKNTSFRATVNYSF